MELKVNKLPLAFMKCPYDMAAKYVTQALLAISLFAVAFSFSISFVYAVKIVLIIVTSVFVTRETEILYLTHDKKIKREEAKLLTKQTYPWITGLIYALLLPVGTPLYVVAVGAFIAIFVGKMVFGGYSYNPFNPAIIGRLFVTLSWPLLLTNQLNGGITNYLLSKFYDGGNVTDIADSTLKTFAIEFNSIFGNIGDIGFILLTLILVFLLIKKVVNPINVFIPIITFVLIIFTVTTDIELTLTLLASNSILFCLIFLANDPFTTPLSNYGKVVYALIIGITSSIMIYLGTSQVGIIYAILFANLFVSYINMNTTKLKFNNKNKVVKLIVISIIAIAITIVTINVADQAKSEVADLVGEVI